LNKFLIGIFPADLLTGGNRSSGRDNGSVWLTLSVSENLSNVCGLIQPLQTASIGLSSGRIWSYIVPKLVSDPYWLTETTSYNSPQYHI